MAEETTNLAAAAAAVDTPAQARCRKVAAEVAGQLARIKKLNPLRPCTKDQLFEKPKCTPLKLPNIAPWTSIRWGDSTCDCIEGDDTEVMHLTVCNVYSNLTLSNLVVNQLVVVRPDGSPVPNLPDGSPAIQLVPRGPYCFGDIPPCSCVTREFVLRLRGAPAGQYRILIRGICFEARIPTYQEDCFLFNVCKD